MRPARLSSVEKQSRVWVSMDTFPVFSYRFLWPSVLSACCTENSKFQSVHAAVSKIYCRTVANLPQHKRQENPKFINCLSQSVGLTFRRQSFKYVSCDDY